MPAMNLRRFVCVSLIVWSSSAALARQATQSGTIPPTSPITGRQGGRGAPPPEPPGYKRIQIKSTFDGTAQNAVVVTPSSGKLSEPRAVVVYLHGWSVTEADRRPDAEAEAEKRGWLLLIPNFRGPYVNHCGSETARQDILDAVMWARQQYDVDAKHVFLLGFSGGGFVSMLMGALHPDVFAAVSAWSGISDLTAWYTQEHPTDRYAESMRSPACFGGAPADSASIAAAYRERSPVNRLRPGLHVPFDLNAQKDDPIVSFSHSLRAFSALAPGFLSDRDTAGLARGKPGPDLPYVRTDPLTSRRIYLRREADDVRVTIREGTHEMLSAAAFAWFDQFQRR